MTIDFECPGMNKSLEDFLVKDDIFPQEDESISPEADRR